jgi:nucleoside-diphosphate-sugar epimerase
MKLLITGSSSSIGQALIKYFSKNNKNIIYALYSNKKPNLIKKNIEYIKYTLSKNQKKLNLDVDVLIHCASAVPSDNKKRMDFIETNYLGSRKLVEDLLNQNLKKIIFLSSMSVYKKNTSKINEKSKLYKNDFYAESKIKFENYLTYLSNKITNLNILVLRLPGYIGISSKNNFISNVKDKIIKNQQVQFINPNAYFNNTIHENTLVRFIKIFIKKEKKRILFLNPASNYPMKLINIIKLMHKAKNKKFNFKVNKSKSKSFIIETKLSNKLGYSSEKTSDEILNFMK